MLASCISRSKKHHHHQQQHQPKSNVNDPPLKTHSSIKSITSQVKDMALKASGSYRQCQNPCTVSTTTTTNECSSNSDRFKWSIRRSGSLNSSSSRQWGKEMEARLKGISFSSNGDQSLRRCFSSGRKLDVPPVIFVPESEPKEWVAQVEPGVLIDFISLPNGGNDLKRIRFSREIYSKLQAQKWWIENCDRVAELYNVQKLHRKTFPVSTPPPSEDESVRIESVKSNSKEMGMDSPSDISEQHCYKSSSSYQGSSGLTSTPKLSSISGTKTETTSSVDMSSRDTDEMSLSNVSELESEWVEKDEAGVYITIRALSDGTRELRRVRFSREKFGEMDARQWWESNRRRIHAQYLS